MAWRHEGTTVTGRRTAQETVPELTKRRRMLVLVICCMSLLIVNMDSTIVNLALYSIHVDLHASLSDLQWTIDIYLLVVGGLVMPAGSVADRVGRRRTFQIGLAVFTFGSLLCSVAPSLGWLVAFRAVQAIGGSMLNPVAMSLIANVFIEPRERAFAIGIWGSVVGISMGLGPVVGGLLIESVSWRGVFWINIPIGIAAIVLTAVFIPESKAPRPRRPDVVGQCLVVLFLAGLIYATIEAPRRHWISAPTLGVFAVALLGGVALIGYERRRVEPLLELRFFRSLPFSGATVIAICSYGAFTGYLFLNTLYLQDVRGLSAVRAGMFTLPMALVTSITAPLSGRLVGTRGTRIPFVIAGAGIGLAGLMLVGLSPGTPLAWVVASNAVFAVGFAMVNTPITNTAVSGMPRSQVGVAAAVASTSRQIGAALGVAVVGSMVNSGLGSSSIRTGLSMASHAGWWLAVGCGAAILVLGVFTSSRFAQKTAVTVALEFGEGNAFA